MLREARDVADRLQGKRTHRHSTCIMNLQLVRSHETWKSFATWATPWWCSCQTSVLEINMDLPHLRDQTDASHAERRVMVIEGLCHALCVAFAYARHGARLLPRVWEADKVVQQVIVNVMDKDGLITARERASAPPSQAWYHEQINVRRQLFQSKLRERLMLQHERLCRSVGARPRAGLFWMPWETVKLKWAGVIFKYRPWDEVGVTP